MSASQEKRRRRELRADTPEVTKAKKRAKTHQTLKKTLITIGVTILVIAVAFAIVWNSALFYTGISALKVGNWKYNAAEFNYFYSSEFYKIYTNIYNTYGEYSYLLVDPTKPLDEQDYSESQTWDQYIEERTLDQIQQLSMLNDAASEEGWTLSEEQSKEIDDSIAAMKSAASKEGKTLKSYLSTYYGKYISEETFRKLVTREVIATYYAAEQLSRLEYTDEELDARYDEKASEFNLITYYSYFASGTPDEEAGIDEDTAMNNAYTAATAIAAAKTEDVFAELVYNYAPEASKEQYKNEDACRHENVTRSNIGNEEAETWLTDPARKYGDTTIITGDTGYTVYMYTESNDNSYTLRTFRNLVIQAAPDEETGEITSDTVALAKAEIDKLYSKWLEDPTEDNFIALAKENSDDTGTAANGGLYQNYGMGYLDHDLESWVFDPARAEGDTNIIYVKNSSYTGYHLVYYIGEGERYDRLLAENDLHTEWYETWIENNAPEYALNKTFGFNFTK